MKLSKSNNRRVFCAEGPGNAVATHKSWKEGKRYPGEFSLTFSGQVESYCAKIDASLYMVSYNTQEEDVTDGKFRIQHLPKPFQNPTGIRFHLGEIYHTTKLAIKAIRFGADTFISNYDTPHRYIFLILRLFSIKVVPILHCTLWPKGYPPQSKLKRLLLKLGSYYYRFGTHGIICVSPECARQVADITNGKSAPLHQIRAQYLAEQFENIDPVPPHEQRPFRILFVGRVIAYKGVFDILDMAQALEAQAPGRVAWDICGNGPDLDKLIQQCNQKGLDKIVSIHGWTDPEKQIEKYGTAHASIVPTRNSFEEGFAMTAVEAVLFGRPIITNPVVPAAEVLAPAAVIAETNNVASYVEEILNLIDDKDLYRQKVEACSSLSEAFFDRGNGLTAVLEKALKT